MAELFQLAILQIRELRLIEVKGIADKDENFCTVYYSGQEHKPWSHTGCPVLSFTSSLSLDKLVSCSLPQDRSLKTQSIFPNVLTIMFNTILCSRCGEEGEDDYILVVFGILNLSLYIFSSILCPALHQTFNVHLYYVPRSVLGAGKYL